MQNTLIISREKYNKISPIDVNRLLSNLDFVVIREKDDEYLVVKDMIGTHKPNTTINKLTLLAALTWNV